MNSAEKLVPAALLICGLFLVYTAVDLTAALWPWQPGEVNWRFGAAGIVSSSMVTPFFCALILSWIAVTQERLWLGRITGGVLLAMSILFVGALILFAIDALQLRSQVQPNAGRSFDWTVVRVAFKQIGSAAIAALLGFTTLRATTRMARKHDRVASGPATLVGAGR